MLRSVYVNIRSRIRSHQNDTSSSVWCSNLKTKFFIFRGDNLFRISQSRFDNTIRYLINDCHYINEANCDSCPVTCVLYRELKSQNIDETPDIMNTLRLLFLDELIRRSNAMKACPRYYELGPQEYYNIISDSRYFRLDENDDLIAIY